MTRYSYHEGLRRLLTEAGHEIIDCVGDGDALLSALDESRPDLAVVDIRMPPTFTHEEGAVAAVEARKRWPELAILLLFAGHRNATTHSGSHVRIPDDSATS